MMMRVRVGGVKKLGKMMRFGARTALDGLAYDIATHLVEEARERTPIDTGNMKANWEAVETGRLTALAENPTHYASFVEFGRRNRFGGRFVPGQKFMTQAIAETEEKLEEIVQTHIAERMKGWTDAG